MRVKIAQVEIETEGDPDDVARVMQGAFGLLGTMIAGALSGVEHEIEG